MVVNVPEPSFKEGVDTETKIKQLQSYCYQLNESLRFILNNLDLDNFNQETVRTIVTTGEAQDTMTDATREFISLRDSIIATAETVRYIGDEFTKELQSSYEATSSALGTYSSDIDAKLTAKANELTLSIGQLDTLITDTKNIVANYQAYITAGLLPDGNGQNVMGIEIGESREQTNNGSTTVSYSDFRSRFTATKLAFMYKNAELAYFTQNMLSIANAEFTDSFTIGNFKISKEDNGAVTVRRIA